MATYWKGGDPEELVLLRKMSSRTSEKIYDKIGVVGMDNGVERWMDSVAECNGCR
ncbi:hypothetical protein ACTXT7_012084, partial [Hymenolepis weldensis]